jgi:hypothetical protein
VHDGEREAVAVTEWLVVYDLTWDEEHLALLAKASAGPSPFGIRPWPAPAGSPEWLAAVERGDLPRGTTRGTVSQVFWGSMADWPEFTMVDETGAESTWTREGDPRRYVAGVAVEVDWVEVEHKAGSTFDRSKTVLQVRLEGSDDRASAVAPGPGGIGYRIAGGPGAVVHYVECELSRAADLEHALAGRNFSIGKPRPIVHATVRGGTPDDVRAAVTAAGARYDGYEVLQADGPPEVYGPGSS